MIAKKSFEEKLKIISSIIRESQASETESEIVLESDIDNLQYELDLSIIRDDFYKKQRQFNESIETVVKPIDSPQNDFELETQLKFLQKLSGIKQP